MTTRKNVPAGALAAALALAGCSTPGPLHVYLVADDNDRNIVDSAAGQWVEQRSFLAHEDQLTGFAYDPYTDHFFLRLAPGNRIRVVDRPARTIKREFEIAGLFGPSGGDLALRPRDGHLFLLHDGGHAIAEATRFGKLVRTFPLNNLTQPGIGVAFDPSSDRLLVLQADGRHLSQHTLDGRWLGDCLLERQAGPSLGFDPAAGEIYAASSDGLAAYVVFGRDGKFRRALPLPISSGFVDVGSRSFLRLF